MILNKSTLCNHDYHIRCERGNERYQKCECECHGSEKKLTIKEELLKFGYEMYDTPVGIDVINSVTREILMSSDVGNDAVLVVTAVLYAASRRDHWSMDEFLVDLWDGGLDFTPDGMLRYKD
jgi:hypothetical protein